MAYQTLYDDAEKWATKRGIDLTHECDEQAAQCQCEPYTDGNDPGEHAPGDDRCASRAQHTICSHDHRRLADAEHPVEYAHTKTGNPEER